MPKQDVQNEHSPPKKMRNITAAQKYYAAQWFKLQREQEKSVKQHWAQGNQSELSFLAWRFAIKVMDAAYLAEALQILKPKNILEVGSFIGFSTRWLLDRTQDWSAHITSVDPNLNDRSFQCPRGHVKEFNAQHLDRLKMIDAFLSISPPFLDDIPENDTRITKPAQGVKLITEPFGEYDFAFIDGDHAFESALLNFVLVARMMPEGGVMIAHDAISCPEVAPAMEALAIASPEIDYKIVGSSFHHDARDTKYGTYFLHSLSFREWNRFRIYLRRIRKSPESRLKKKLDQCDGLGIIKVRDGQKLADLDLDHLLAKKDEMLPQKDEIVRRRALPDDDLSNYLP